MFRTLQVGQVVVSTCVQLYCRSRLACPILSDDPTFPFKGSIAAMLSRVWLAKRFPHQYLTPVEVLTVS